MFPKSERFPNPKEDPIPGPNTYNLEEKRTQIPISFSTAKRFESPAAKLEYNPGADQQVAIFAKPESESPMSKFHTPLKIKTEIASLKEEVDDLRHQLREESARKKAVMKDIDVQAKQLAASESRLRSMETKLRELAHSKTTLSAEKAASDKEVIQLKAKWDNAAKKLGKIQEIVARAQSKLVTVEKERQAAEQRVASLTSQLETKKDLDRKCIELEDKLMTANRQIEQLTLELNTTKEAYNQTERSTEETQGQIYALASTVSQLRADLETEMNYSMSRKTELSLLQLEKNRLENELQQAQDAFAEFKKESNEQVEKIQDRLTSSQTHLATVTTDYEEFRQERDGYIRSLESSLQNYKEELALRSAEVSELEHSLGDLDNQNKSLIAERNLLQAECDSLSNEIVEKQKEVRRLEERVSALESSMTYLQGEMAAQTEEMNELKNERDVLVSQLDLKDSAIQHAKTIQEQLTQSLNEATDKIAALEQSLADAKAEHAKQINQIQADGEMKLKQIEQSESDKIQSVHEQLLEIQKQAKVAQQTAKEDLESMRLELEAERIKLLHSQNELEQQLRSREELEISQQALQLKLNQSQQELDAQNKRVEEMERELESSKKEHQESASLFESQVSQISLLKSSITDLEEKLSVKLEELEESNRKIVEQQAKVSELESEVSKLNDLATMSTSSLASLQAQLEQSNAEIEKISVKRDFYQSQVVELQSATDGLSEALKSVNQELEQIQKSTTEEIKRHVAELNNANERLAELELESSQAQTKYLESQCSSVNTISDLRLELQSAKEAAESTQLTLEKQLEVLTSVHQGQLEGQKFASEQKLKEVEEMCAQQISRQAQEHSDYINSLTRSHESKILALEESHQLEIQALREQLDSATSSHYKQVTSLHTSIENMKAELDASKRSSDERVQSLEEKLQQFTEAAQQLSQQLTTSNELVSELTVEKDQGEILIRSLRSEVDNYRTQLSETDSHLEQLQTENDQLKETIESMKKDHAKSTQTQEAQLKDVIAEKKQWAVLAESLKKDMEETFQLLSSTQDEYDKLKAHVEDMKRHKEAEEHEANDLRVKKLSHEVRMLNAELSRQKTRIAARETAIAAGKLREEKLQSNLDAQIEKTKELQRQLSDRDRETIIERGRARAPSKPTPVVQTSTNPDMPTIDEVNSLYAKLEAVQSENAKLVKMLEVEKAQIETLIAEQTKLTGHNNPKQKIQFTHKLMKENHDLKLERANLLALLEKKPILSPAHRKSLTRPSVRIRPAPSAFVIPSDGKENGDVSNTCLSPVRNSPKHALSPSSPFASTAIFKEHLQQQQ